MKLVKLSAVAILALTTSLQAAEVKFDERLGISVAGDKGYTERKEKDSTIKFDGQLRFWYQSMNHEGAIGRNNTGAQIVDQANGQRDKGLFQRDTNQANEWGNVEAQFSVSGNINDYLKAKGTFMAVSTMGMDNLLTSFSTARTSSTGALDGSSAQPFWVHEAFLDYAFTKNTEVRVGRMELDTPLIFTEKWNATANAFEAITANNTDLPKTTLTAAYIAKGNGAQQNLRAAPQVFGAEATFNNMMKFNDVNASSAGGILAVGGVNKSMDFMPLQAWGYLCPDSAQAYWTQADATVKDLGAISSASLQLIGAGIGLQGSASDYIKNGKFAGTVGGPNAHQNTKMTNAVAGKVAASASIFTARAAASKTSKGNLAVANMGTNYKKTKLPTASIFNDGMVVAQPNTTAWLIGASAAFAGIGTLDISYGSSLVGRNAGYQNTTGPFGGPASMGYIAQMIQGKDLNVNELDIVFNTKVKDVDLAFMYMKVNNTYVPVLGSNGAPVTNGVSKTGHYGDLSNDIVRIVATLKF